MTNTNFKVGKYTDKDIDETWNNAVKECIRLVNAHSKTGNHDWSIDFWLMEERIRQPLVSKMKSLIKS